MNPTISILIPTLQAGKYLESLICNLQDQSIKPLEIIIIDSKSTDDTQLIARKCGCLVKVIDRAQFNHGRTRNLAAQFANGELYLFMTQDAIPQDKDFVKKLIQPIVEYRAVASSARQVPKEKSSPLEVFARKFNYPSYSFVREERDIARLGIKAYFFSNVSSCIRRDKFWEVGGFPNNVIMNEDMYLCAKLLHNGYKVAYVSEAVVVHSHDLNLVELFKRYFDIGVFYSDANSLLIGSKVDGEGITFVSGLLKYLIRNRKWSWLPRGLSEQLIKYIAFKLGSKQKIIPNQFRYRFSMNKEYWN